MSITVEPKVCKTALILDDNQFFQDSIIWGLEGLIDNGELRLLQAINIVDGFVLFDENINSIDLIFIDGCVPGETLNTTGFSRHVASKTNGKVLVYAMSSDKRFRKIQLENGCMIEVDDKKMVPKIIEEFLRDS